MFLKFMYYFILYDYKMIESFTMHHAKSSGLVSVTLTLINVIISFARSKNNDTHNNTALYRIQHYPHFDKDIYHNLTRSRSGSGSPAMLFKNSLHGPSTCDPQLPRKIFSPAPHQPPSHCISNKFLHHHCHVDTAKEVVVFNVHSALKITPCVIVLQRKAIVCPWEAPQSWVFQLIL